MTALRKYYGEVKAVDRVDLEIACGEVVALLGPNGAASPRPSTLCPASPGLTRARSGSLEAPRKKRSGKPRRSHDAGRRPHRPGHGRRGGELVASVHRKPLAVSGVLACAGAEGIAGRDLAALSGGQKQWVSADIPNAQLEDLLAFPGSSASPRYAPSPMPSARSWSAWLWHCGQRAHSEAVAGILGGGLHRGVGRGCRGLCRGVRRQKTGGVASDLWVRRFHPSPEARIRLVCFPHAGGSATYFFPVSGALKPGVEVLALQYPGRQDRRNESRIQNIDELADRLHGAIAPWCQDGTAFFGHSMGAILAFEVARRLERKEGISPAALIVSGRRGPSTERVETVHQRSEAGLVRELQDLSGTDTAMLDDEEFVQMVLPAMRSDYTAIENYRYDLGPPVSCPILALTGDHDPKTTVEEVENWARHTSGSFDLKVYQGGHFYLNDRAAEVIRTIADYLRSLPL